MSVELLAALDPPSPLQHPAETQLHAFGAGAAARLGRQVCRDHTLAGGGWAAPDQAESSRFTTRCMGQSRQHLVEPAITLGRHIGALVTGEVTAGYSGDLAWILWMGRVRPRRWSSPGTRARQRAAAAMHYDLPAQGCSVAARSDTPLLTVAHQRQGTP